MAERRTQMGTYVFACQILLNPKADTSMGFQEDWLNFWPAQRHDNLNKYILVDPASSKKKKENDYTVIMVVGLGPDRNYYVVDMLRDRLNLTEKARRVLYLHQQYQPLGVGYEEYGLQADIEYIKLVQQEVNYRFKITELGGATSKNDRIAAFLPIVEAGRLFLPERMVRQNYLGHQEDLTQAFIREAMVPWPYGLHDDMLDTLARIMDAPLGATFPLHQPIIAEGADERRNEWDPMEYLH
jgi:predicted phage terminase large subunit-like protein